MKSYALPGCTRNRFKSASPCLFWIFRSFSYDFEEQILLVHDSKMHACLVDTSAVLDALIASPGVWESKVVVSIIGYLERVEVRTTHGTLKLFWTYFDL